MTPTETPLERAMRLYSHGTVEEFASAIRGLSTVELGSLTDYIDGYKAGYKAGARARREVVE